MLIHPDIHREIARQRHQDLVVAAERQRLVDAYSRAIRRRSAARHIRDRRRIFPGEGAWELRGSADRS
jgi:hypothetical protein